MRTVKIFVVLFFLVSCDKSGNGPKYEYAIDYYIPDSLQGQYREWIKETVRATNQHLSAGDYEDVPAVIRQAEWTGEKLFKVRGEGLNYNKSTTITMDEFIPYEKLTKKEKIIFKSLKK